MNWFVLKSNGISYNICLFIDNNILSIFIRDQEHKLFYGICFNDKFNNSYIYELLNTYINNSKNTSIENSVNIIFTLCEDRMSDNVGLFTIFDYKKITSCFSFGLRLAPTDGSINELFSANEALYASKTLIDLKYGKKNNRVNHILL